METRQRIFHLAGTSAAIVAIAVAVAQTRRERRARRFALAEPRGPLAACGLRMAGAALMATCVAPIVFVAGSFELVPRGETLPFVLMLAWTTTLAVTVLFVLITEQPRWGARGWLSLHGEDEVHVSRPGEVVVWRLSPGSVRAQRWDGAGFPGVQLFLRGGEGERGDLAIWCPLPGPRQATITDRHVGDPAGLQVVGDTEVLLAFLEPFFVRIEPHEPSKASGPSTKPLV